jgi:ABC-2 type transport system permease protein
MARIAAIFTREFRGYFNSLMAYFFIVVFLGVVNFIFIWFILLPSGQARMQEYFEFFIYGLWIFVPAITMRAWAEEKKLGTLELLLTLPVKDHEAVLGKYLAALCFLSFVLLLSLTVPLCVALLGDPDPGPIIGGYVGLFLLGGAFIAVGTAISSMTENQFIAFLLTVLVCVALLSIEELFTMLPLPGFIAFLVQFLDVGRHFDSIGRGVIDSRDVIFYLCLIAFFLFLNIRSVESRKWS